MHAYDLVVEYLKSGKYELVNSVRVYYGEKIVVFGDNDFYVVIQAHDENAWEALVNVARENPEYLKSIVDYVEKTGSGALPSTISVMRVKKEDLD